MRPILAVLLFACWCVPARAADSGGAHAVRGVGLVTCEQFLQEAEKKSSVFFMIGGWIDGYVTGVNHYAPDTYDALSFESTELVVRLIEGHCKARPADRLFAVAAAFLARFSDDRIRAQSPIVRGKVGDQEFAIYAEVLRRAQRRLTDLGYYKGEPEADYGERTRSAFAAYQERSGMRSTGLPDQGTLWRLLRQPADK
ncbi:MAG: peptidoglycan-binding protein [Burkholderiales bacterium]|nr:peptidoglycan-binding protein [Burkholderiales bacterium]